MSELWLKIALIITCALGGIASTYILRLPKDNVVEEYAEKVIEKQTGVLIDLSPDTPDPDNK